MIKNPQGVISYKLIREKLIYYNEINLERRENMNLRSWLHICWLVARVAVINFFMLILGLVIVPFLMIVEYVKKIIQAARAAYNREMMSIRMAQMLDTLYEELFSRLDSM